jgi:hypothetical protein
MREWRDASRQNRSERKRRRDQEREAAADFSARRDRFNAGGPFWTDDARVKIKVAASLFPIRFIAVTRTKGGSWVRESFS